LNQEIMACERALFFVVPAKAGTQPLAVMVKKGLGHIAKNETARRMGPGSGAGTTS
jgi:hypothetical protein